jgi:hypothetical protein
VAGDDGAELPRERIGTGSGIVKSILAVIFATGWEFDKYDRGFFREIRKGGGA